MVPEYVPGYLSRFTLPELRCLAHDLYDRMESCDLCPRQCGVNRLKGELGFCRSSAQAKIASWNIHTGEEPPISGIHGSGTIFFSNCTLGCIFCQNFPISQLGVGSVVDDQTFADYMLSLQKKNAHNINLVTPTHYLPAFVKALCIAVEKGLHLPIVYNTSGFESLDILRKIDGLIDIYLPDIRYAEADFAAELSDCPIFVKHNRPALLEMYRQVGDLVTDDEGIGEYGMIIRHLIVPEYATGTPDCLKFIAENIGRKIHISLMSQYFPAHKATDHSLMKRRITLDEYDYAVQLMDDYGFEDGWIQPLELD